MSNVPGTQLYKKINYWVSDYFKVIKQGIRSISRDNITLLASGMVYSTLIAIVPCFTFLSAFLSAFGALEPFMGVLSEWFLATFGAETGTSLMSSFVQFTGSAMSLGVVGLISFIITGMFLVNKIYSLVNHIFRTEPTEGTMKRFMLILIFLIVLTVALTFGFALSASLHEKVYALLGSEIDRVSMPSFLRQLLQLAVVFFLFFLVIIAVPNVKIRVSAAVTGGALGTVLVYLATFIFTRAISYMVGYSVIYGSMASILFILLYFYILWYLIVVVLEITYIYQFRPDKNTLIGKPVSGERQIADGIDLMVTIAERFNEGKGYTSLRELCSSTISMTQVRNVLSDLEGASLITPINANASAYMLSKPASKIMVNEIIDAVFSSSSPSGHKRNSSGREIAKTFRDLGLKGENVSLEDLIKMNYREEIK